MVQVFGYVWQCDVEVVDYVLCKCGCCGYVDLLVEYGVYGYFEVVLVVGYVQVGVFGDVFGKQWFLGQCGVYDVQVCIQIEDLLDLLYDIGNGVWIDLVQLQQQFWVFWIGIDVDYVGVCGWVDYVLVVVVVDLFDIGNGVVVQEVEYCGEIQWWLVVQVQGQGGVVECIVLVVDGCWRYFVVVYECGVEVVQVVVVGCYCYVGDWQCGFG